MFKLKRTPMEKTRYRVMEITDGHDSKFGKVWIIKANPTIVNEFSGTTSIMSDIYEGTDTFIVPSREEWMFDEIENVAKCGKLWTPKTDEWRTEVAFDEKKQIKTTIHRYTEPANFIVTDKKPLRQYLIERNEDVQIFKSIESGKMLFLCGKTKGYVSPAASEKIDDFCCSMDNFEFGMVSKDEEDAIPCIMLSTKKKL